MAFCHLVRPTIAWLSTGLQARRFAAWPAVLGACLLGTVPLVEGRSLPVATALYFPLLPGSVYQYRFTGGNAATATVTVSVGHTWGAITGLTQFDWRQTCRVGLVCGIVLHEYWRQDPAGLGYYGGYGELSNGAKNSTYLTIPALVLPPTVVPGTPNWAGGILTYPDADMWTNQVAGTSTLFGPQTYTPVYAANTLETVSVPAGVFATALQVYENRGGYRRNMWFAPGVGLVKYVELNSPVTVELFSYNIPNSGGGITTATAVEYYHAGLDHYFVSANADEIDKLDRGYFQGWTRTGYSFKVVPAGAVTPAGASPVCRFYGNPAYGLDSHFYSASPLECGQVKTKFPNEWIFEADVVFQVYLPDTTTGACPVGTTPVYRSWNQRSDSNHRYTTNTGVQAQMVAKGYVAEGYGNPPVVMCGLP